MMKNLRIKCLTGLLAVGLCLGSRNVYAAPKEQPQQESESFSFIKSGEEETSNILYDGRLLLYGGICLVFISISGMIFTLLPPKKKRHHSKKQSYSQKR